MWEPYDSWNRRHQTHKNISTKRGVSHWDIMGIYGIVKYQHILVVVESHKITGGDILYTWFANELVWQIILLTIMMAKPWWLYNPITWFCHHNVANHRRSPCGNSFIE